MYAASWFCAGMAFLPLLGVVRDVIGVLWRTVRDTRRLVRGGWQSHVRWWQKPRYVARLLRHDLGRQAKAYWHGYEVERCPRRRTGD